MINNKIADLETSLFEELSDDELVAVVGGAGLVDLETQSEKLNPSTEIGKTLLKGLETLVKAAEGKFEVLP